MMLVESSSLKGIKMEMPLWNSILGKGNYLLISQTFLLWLMQNDTALRPSKFREDHIIAGTGWKIK